MNKCLAVTKKMRIFVIDSHEGWKARSWTLL